MITRTPEDEARLKELTEELAKLVESTDELYLLVTFIREFFRVKREYKDRRLKQGKLELIKPRRQTRRRARR